ncbi:hypothetical protein [Nonlabens sp. Asnod3-A02]|uniref:hypothetical protein n=1 Tax=Nonlabens sp. Asnod3-A02 TaxID=3160579 RepID=UPI00386AE08B
MLNWFKNDNEENDYRYNKLPYENDSRLWFFRTRLGKLIMWLLVVFIVGGLIYTHFIERFLLPNFY